MQPPSGSPPDQYPPTPPVPGSYRPPGTVTAVRVLLVIGAVVGLLLGLLMAVAVVMLPMAADMPEAQRVFERQGVDPDTVLGTVVIGLAESLVYGAIALVLALVIGRRSTPVFWAAVVFFALAAVYSVGSMVLVGELFANAVSLLFNAAALVLLSLPASRAHYGVGS